MTPQDVDTRSLEELIRYAQERKLLGNVAYREGAVVIPAGDQTMALSAEEALPFLRALVRAYLSEKP